MKSDGVFHEKGVDVEIAVALLVAAYEDMVDRIIVVSSDPDLLPAIKNAQEKGKVVEYIGFSHQSSLALIARCGKSRLLDKADLRPFVSQGPLISIGRFLHRCFFFRILMLHPKTPKMLLTPA